MTKNFSLIMMMFLALSSTAFAQESVIVDIQPNITSFQANIFSRQL